MTVTYTRSPKANKYTARIFCDGCKSSVLIQGTGAKDSLLQDSLDLAVLAKRNYLRDEAGWSVNVTSRTNRTGLDFCGSCPSVGR